MLPVAVLVVWFDEESCHVGKTCLTRKWGQALAKSQQGTDAFTLTAHEEVNSTNNHVGLGADLFSTVSSDETLGLAEPWFQP